MRRIPAARRASRGSSPNGRWPAYSRLKSVDVSVHGVPTGLLSTSLEAAERPRRPGPARPRGARGRRVAHVAVARPLDLRQEVDPAALDLEAPAEAVAAPPARGVRRVVGI